MIPKSALEALNKLVELAEKATPGPWFAGYWSGSCRKPEHLGNHPGPRGDNPCVYEYDLIGGEYFGRYVSAGTKDARIGIVYSSEEPTLTREDAEFIAAARNAIPDLIALLAQGQGEAAAREIVSMFIAHGTGKVGEDIEKVAAIIRKHFQHSQERAGWVLVPREPTAKMKQAGGTEFLAARYRTSTSEQTDAERIYKLMLAAAPDSVGKQ